MRSPLIVLGILTIAAACGSLQDMQSQGLDQMGIANAAEAETASSSTASLNNASERKEPDFSFLSTDAQAVLNQVKGVHELIRAKVDAICAPDTTLRETVKAAMDAADSEAAREAVFAQYKTQIEADRDRMKSCMTENESALSVWKDLGKTLHEACMIGGGRGRGPHDHGPGKGGRGGKGRAPLTDEQKQEFETKLMSASCSQAITDAQGKL